LVIMLLPLETEMPFAPVKVVLRFKVIEPLPSVSPIMLLSIVTAPVELAIPLKNTVDVVVPCEIARFLILLFEMTTLVAALACVD